MWKVRGDRGKRWRSRDPETGAVQYHKGDADLAEALYRNQERPAGHVIVLGGETDTETAWEYAPGDLSYVCAPVGESSTKADLGALQDAERVTVLYDADRTGRTGAQEMAKAIIEHRRTNGLPTIQVTAYGGPGESGADLKDAVTRVPHADRKDAAREWIETGIQGATPPRVPRANAPYGSESTVIADWLFRQTGAYLGKHQYEGHQVLSRSNPNPRQPSEWIVQIGGTWVKANFPRAAQAWVRSARIELKDEIRSLKRVIDGKEPGIPAPEDSKPTEKRIKYLQGIRKELEDHGKITRAVEAYRAEVDREPEEFDQAELVIGLPPNVDNPTEALIRHRRDIQSGKEAHCFDPRTGKMRLASPEDRITRHIAVPIETKHIPPEGFTVEDLAHPGSESQRWIMNVSPGIWGRILEVSGIPDEARFRIDSKTAAAIVETCGLCLLGIKQGY
ncbi:MAG: hypothetical protein OXG70_01270, partial [Cyanobacteria bacterium MAG IRC1_bin_28]|nr:hypothetical protein [Cyanobacteria bacterium MAG IRC1_bin_28]